ncbi:MAG: hypothetical protein M1827_001363 [Pycnora praestabilis]|nr:MAG: hypothetical protein M1827_001363 [Pycnora praestabilis]
MSSSDEQQPSMINGHVQYAKGAISSMLGTSGAESTKQAGIEEMRAARAANPENQTEGNTYVGKVENLAGSAVGCEGMKDEGAKKAAGGE